jgi:ankyrin repeat protein
MIYRFRAGLAGTTVEPPAAPPPLPRRRWLWVIRSPAALGAAASLAAIVLRIAFYFGVWPFNHYRASDYFSDPVVVRLADAVAQGDAAEIDALVKQGADVNATGKLGYTLLTWAMFNSNPRGFESLLDHGADPFRPAWDRPEGHSLSEKPPFVAELCVGTKRSDYLKALLKRGMDPNHPRSDGTPMLFHAVWQRHIPHAAMLLDAGADINSVSQGDGYTPLMNAVAGSQFEMAMFLLKWGADPTIRTKWQHNAVDVIQDPSRGYTATERRHRAEFIQELKRQGYL